MCFIGPALLSIAMSFKLLPTEFDLKYVKLIKELLEQGVYLKPCNNLCFWWNESTWLVYYDPLLAAPVKDIHPAVGRMCKTREATMGGVEKVLNSVL